MTTPDSPYSNPSNPHLPSARLPISDGATTSQRLLIDRTIRSNSGLVVQEDNPTKFGTSTNEEIEAFQWSPNLRDIVLDGRYRVLDPLGEGAMSVVFNAIELSTGKRVAAKVLKIREPELIARFAREVKIYERLKHPNIVDAIECVYGPENICVSILEFIEGENLEKLLEREGKIRDLLQLVSIFSQLCNGLEYAHDRGIIHRDLKPDNVIVNIFSQGTSVKILDFGLAKMHKDMQRLTKSGIVLGSPAYMSPEQCMGEDLDERSDIYSLGILFFELLSGKLPYMEKTAVGMMRAHCDQDKLPQKLSHFTEMTPYLESIQSIVDKMIAKEPDRRYDNVNELKKDLNQWWHSTALASSGTLSPFTFVALSKLKKSKTKQDFNDDYQELTDLLDRQRLKQNHTIRAKFKEGKLPSKSFNPDSLLPIAIVIAVFTTVATISVLVLLMNYTIKNTQDPLIQGIQSRQLSEANSIDSNPSISTSNSSSNRASNKSVSTKKILRAPGWVEKIDRQRL